MGTKSPWPANRTLLLRFSEEAGFAGDAYHSLAGCTIISLTTTSAGCSMA